jgi:uncharacterized protein YrrD
MLYHAFMHVRFTACIGFPVVDDTNDEEVAVLHSPLVHPDLGTVEGFFVAIPKFMHTDILFISVMDIVHWGASVRIRDRECIGPIEERVRLQAFLEEGRTMYGQRLLTEGGLYLGICKDLQFNTKTFVLEWLFPRKWFRWGLAVPVSAVVEVKREAVMLRDQNLMQEIREKTPILRSLEELATPPAAGMSCIDAGL